MIDALLKSKIRSFKQVYSTSPMYLITGRKLPPPPEVPDSMGQELPAEKQGRDVLGTLNVMDLNELHMRETFNQACVQANKLVRDSGKANVDGLRIPVVSNWNVQYLQTKLCNYENKQIIDLLRYGFLTECKQQQGTAQIPANHAGALGSEQDVDQYINRELLKGTLIGPFTHNPFGADARFSPMNTRPKKDSAEHRIILDLSFPEGGSINDGINKDRYRGKEVNLKLPGVDVLLQIIFKKGKACLLFRRDLKSAYKQVPVCIGEIHLLGYTHKGLLYFDLTLPMGLSNSAFICQQVTDMIMYIFKQEGYDGTNYLDDLAAAELLELAQQAYQILADILVACGAQETEVKAIPPSTCMLFLVYLLTPS